MRYVNFVVNLSRSNYLSLTSDSVDFNSKWLNLNFGYGGGHLMFIFRLTLLKRVLKMYLFVKDDHLAVKITQSTPLI